jgi:S1-C subfamily serine protease
MFEKKKRMSQNLRVSLLALIVGVISGTIGAVLTENYLIQYSDQLEDAGIPLRLVEEKPRPLPGTYEEAIEQIRTQALPSLVQVYQIKSAGASLSNQVYLPDQALSAGVIVTSDGWLVASGHLNDLYAVGSLAVVIDDQVYFPEQMVEDSATGLALIKIEANGLPVLAFGAANEIEAGDLAFVLPSANSLLSSSIIGSVTSGDVDHPAEEMQTLWQLSDEQDETALGAPIANSTGELIGLLIDSSGLVRPIHHVLPAIESVLKTGEVSRPEIGLSVIEIATAVGLSEDSAREYNYGALVTQVDYLGAADQSELIKLDIILEINSKRIDAENLFADMLLDYKSGDLLRLKIDRDGEVLEVNLTLD